MNPGIADTISILLLAFGLAFALMGIGTSSVWLQEWLDERHRGREIDAR